MKKPNILLITSDQQHFDTLGITNPRIRTPNLDRLCREGTRFERAYCCNPLCSPSRSSILTGLYPSWHHCWTIGVKLPEDVPTVGEALHAGGYSSTLIGKAHFQPTQSGPGQESLECPDKLRDLEFWKSFHGPWYGFDHIELARNHGDEYLAGQHYALWMEEKGLKNWRDYFQSWPPNPQDPVRVHLWDLPEEFHYTTWTAERTIASMERSVAEEKPFFIWASFQDPHPPYLVPEPWASLYNPDDMMPGRGQPGEFDQMPPHFAETQKENPDFSAWEDVQPTHGFASHLIEESELRKSVATYYGMISFMDQQIGRILDALQRLNIEDETLVVFTTDHGHFLGQHGLTAKGPFHYEDLVRVPFIVRYPGRVPAGKTSSALQSLVDLAPTFLDAAGLPVPGLMQGISQFPTWSGAPAARDHVLVENRHQPSKVHLRTFIGERYKMTLYRDHPYGELFDLQNDPGEFCNRWADPDYQEIKAQVFHQFLNAEIKREPTRHARVGSA